MTENSIAVHGFNKMANFFLVLENQSATLIDTGGKDKIENIRAKFEKTGYDLSRLQRIIITHSHFDHTGSLAELKRATEALVLAHEAEVPYLTQQARLPRPAGPVGFMFGLLQPFFRTPGAEVDVILHDGDLLEGTGLKVIHTPGHTPGHICLYHPAAKALFTGDSIVNRKGRLQGPVHFFSSDIFEARRSVGRLAELEIETIYFAHGEIMRGVPKNLLRSLSLSLAK